jgi:hypothetical protein
MFTLYATTNRYQDRVQGDRKMRIAIYIVIAVVSAYVSNEGRSVSYQAIETAGTPDSLALFEFGQSVFIIAGTIAIMFSAAAAMNIIKKVGK